MLHTMSENQVRAGIKVEKILKANVKYFGVLSKCLLRDLLQVTEGSYK